MHQRNKCVPRIPEWSRENSWSTWQGWMAAHWRHWEMASCKQNCPSGSIHRINVIVGRCIKYRCDCLSVLVRCRTARWRSLTGRRIFSSWRRVNTSPQRRSKWSIISVNLWPRYLFMGTVYRSGNDGASVRWDWRSLHSTDPPPTCLLLGMPCWCSCTWPRDFARLDQEKGNWKFRLWTVQKQGQIFFKIQLISSFMLTVFCL